MQGRILLALHFVRDEAKPESNGQSFDVFPGESYEPALVACIKVYAVTAGNVTPGISSARNHAATCRCQAAINPFQLWT